MMNPEDRYDPRTYNLSEIQLAYLVEGDVGTRKEAKLEEEVKEVAANLDKRIRYLIEDIALLHITDYLDSDSGSLSWNQLADMPRGDRLYDPPVMLHGIKQTDMDYIELAIHFGHILRLLYTDTAPEFDKTMAGVGVLIGLNGGFLKDSLDENSSLKSFVESLSEESEHFDVFRMPDETTIEDVKSILTELNESIDAVPATETEPEGLLETLRESSLTITEPLVNRADQKLKTAEYPPEYVMDQVIEELESDTELQAIERLASIASEDIEKLSSSNYRKATAIQVFYSLCQAGEYVHPSDITGTANTEKHQVQKFLNDLQGREHPWSDRPLVVEETTGYTPSLYGNFLGHLLESDNSQDTEITYEIPARKEITTMCHEYIFGKASKNDQELIESVLNEVVNRTNSDE